MKHRGTSPSATPARRIPASLHVRYEAAKKRWLSRNPGATAEQIEDAFILIARRVGV